LQKQIFFNLLSRFKGKGVKVYSYSLKFLQKLIRHFLPQGKRVDRFYLQNLAWLISLEKNRRFVSKSKKCPLRTMRYGGGEEGVARISRATCFDPALRAKFVGFVSKNSYCLLRCPPQSRSYPF